VIAQALQPNLGRRKGGAPSCYQLAFTRRESEEIDNKPQRP